MNDAHFTDFLISRGHELYRDMPWRRDTRPYYIWVSEIMLQQTQVDRVVPKFQAFVRRFPDIETLAEASLADVLVLWSGLGYNRRAKYLWEGARQVQAQFEGVIPSSQTQLVSLRGVGPNTAGAICVYAYNQPVLFVETNIRTVYFHHFFEGQTQVDDAAILDKLLVTLDREHPREFYWALMDYGSWLKRSGVKNTAASKHYRKQSPLAGSVREVRGAIIRALVASPMSFDELRLACDSGDDRFALAFEQLIREALIVDDKTRISLTK